MTKKLRRDDEASKAHEAYAAFKTHCAEQFEQRTGLRWAETEERVRFAITAERENAFGRSASTLRAAFGAATELLDRSDMPSRYRAFVEKHLVPFAAAHAETLDLFADVTPPRAAGDRALLVRALDYPARIGTPPGFLGLGRSAEDVDFALLSMLVDNLDRAAVDLVAETPSRRARIWKRVLAAETETMRKNRDRYGLRLFRRSIREMSAQLEAGHFDEPSCPKP